MSPIEGGCQCGKIRYRVTAEPLAVVACHCTECQRQTGSAFGISMVLPREAFELVTGEPRSFSRGADSGGTVECTFCGDCGTRIHHMPSKLTKTLNLKPGTLDDTSWLNPTLHVWVSSKQPWVPIPDGVPRFDRNPGPPPEGG